MQIEDEKEPGAGCPACPFALGHGGGLGALAVQLQLAPVEVSSVYVARREEAKPHICGEPPSPSAGSGAVTSASRICFHS